MSISADNDRLTVIIPKRAKERLKEFADNENRSISNYVVNILMEHIAEKEDKLYIDINVPDEEGRGLQRNPQRQLNQRKPIRDEVAENSPKYNKE